MPRWFLVGCLVCRTLLPGEAAADEPTAPGRALEAATPRSISGDERVTRLNDEGSALYAAGDFRHAVERFLQAYAIDPDPNLLFNIASCYEGLGDTDAAVEKYRDFLAAPSADPEGRPRAEAAIARLLEERTAPDAEPLQVASPPPPRETPLPAPLAAPVALREPPPVAPAWLPWVGLGGGGALAAIGATFYLLGGSDHGKVMDAPGYGDPNAVSAMTRKRADDLVRSGNTKKAIGVTSASVGGALAAGYLVWWLLDPMAPTSEAAHLELTVTESNAHASFVGRF